MLSTMQDFPLTLKMIFEHGATVHARSEIVTFEGDTTRRASFADVARRGERLASALALHPALCRQPSLEDGDDVR